MTPPKSTYQEIVNGFKQPTLWYVLAWFDIKQRYRRSVLGPLWLTISTGILVGTLGFLWSHLFKIEIDDYLPYFAAGHIIWGLISLQLNEACTGFTQFEHILKQIRLPLSVYTLRLISRNMIIFAHNFIIAIIALLIFPKEIGWQTLLFAPGLILLGLFLTFSSIIIAIIATRYRDAQPLIQNFITIAFFVTPVMWKTESLSAKNSWISEINPLTHLINVVRLPLLGSYPTAMSWTVAVSTTALAVLCSAWLLNRYRHRITYWL